MQWEMGMVGRNKKKEKAILLTLTHMQREMGRIKKNEKAILLTLTHMQREMGMVARNKNKEKMVRMCAQRPALSPSPAIINIVVSKAWQIHQDIIFILFSYYSHLPQNLLFSRMMH